MDLYERDIIGHMGFFSLDDIKIPSSGPDPVDYSLSTLRAIHSKSDVWVSAHERPGYRSFGTGSEAEFGSYRLVTDIEGRVIWCVEFSGGTANAEEGFVQGEVIGHVNGHIATETVLTVAHGVVALLSLAL